MPHADNFIKPVSLCGNDSNVKFGVLEDSHTPQYTLLYKYCCNPARYDEYAVCFQYEFQKMKELEELMNTNGFHENYSQLFPTYYDYDRTADGAPYLKMDYIDGITLEYFLSHSPRSCELLPKQILDPGQIWHLFSQLDQAQHWLSLVHILQLDLSPKNIILCNDNPDIRLIDFTDVYYLDHRIRRKREALRHSHHLIDHQANPELPPARQLQEAGVLLFTRLFYQGQNGYLNYRPRDSFFHKHNYSGLLDCLYRQDMNPGPAEDPCYYWDCWINQLFHCLRQK